MINEKEFVNHYTFYWNKIFPFSNRLIRKLNLQKEYYLDPIVSSNNPDSRSVVNEIAFRLFEKCIKNKKNISEISDQEILLIVKSTLEYIANIGRNSNYNICYISEEELSEAKKIAVNIKYYTGNDIEVAPKFKGCSIINSCYGDIKSKTCIYEIKSGDRDFRVNDIRQLLLYALLNYASNNTYEYIGLINPRKCNAIEISIREAIEMASGRDMGEVFNDILEFIDTSEEF